MSDGAQHAQFAGNMVQGAGLRAQRHGHLHRGFDLGIEFVGRGWNSLDEPVQFPFGRGLGQPEGLASVDEMLARDTGNVCCFATRGDGLGYDIQSFEANGEPRYIEVKTTSFGERTPFFVSANELSFSREKEQQFRLYRLFDFRAAPRLFELDGPIDRHCLLDPTTYRAAFG